MKSWANELTLFLSSPSFSFLSSNATSYLSLSTRDHPSILSSRPSKLDPAALPLSYQVSLRTSSARFDWENSVSFALP